MHVRLRASPAVENVPWYRFAGGAAVAGVIALCFVATGVTDALGVGSVLGFFGPFSRWGNDADEERDAEPLSPDAGGAAADPDSDDDPESASTTDSEAESTTEAEPIAAATDAAASPTASDGGEPVASDYSSSANGDGSHSSGPDWEQFSSQLVSAMEQCADGDLTVRMDTDRDDRNAVAVANAFNGMLDEFEDTIQTVDEFGDQVDGATERVTSRVDEVKQASKEVSHSVSGISEDTTKQHEMIDDLSDEIRSLSAATEEVASSANEVAQASETAAERGEEGR